MNANKHSKKVVHLPKFIQKNHTAILFSLLLFLMLPVTFVHAQRLYTTDGVNVRAKPNSSSKVLTSVSAGTSVTKTGRSGNWIAVRVNGIKGYIYKSYLSGSKNTSTATVSKSTSYRAVITASSVNLRAKPSFSSRVKGSLSAGQAVTVCSTNGSWKKVQTSKGKKGYVYGMLGKVLHHQRLQPRKLLLLLLAVTEQKQSPTQKEELAINTASLEETRKDMLIALV